MNLSAFHIIITYLGSDGGIMHNTTANRPRRKEEREGSQPYSQFQDNFKTYGIVCKIN
jgi:hypothetical protein